MKKAVQKHNITNQSLQFPEKKQIPDTMKAQIGPNEKTLISVSGGADSILAANLVYNFYISNKYSLQNLYFIHFNHKIRHESDQEEDFVKKYFTGTNLTCTTFPALGREGLGVGLPKTEANLRSRRYAEMQKLCKKNKIGYVILGHHLGDRIESTFLNLLRGAGIKGFISMQRCEQHPLIKNTQVMRPLLSLSKSKILDICKKNNIPFVTDQSNFDSTTSIRNKLRNEIMPALFALNTNKNSQKTFEQSMLNIYQELENKKIEKGNKKPTYEGGLGGLVKINQSPHRKSKFAYQRNITPKNITTGNIIEVLQQLGIYKNISSAFLQELKKFLSTAKDGHKYFQKTYFFVAHTKIYIIQAPENFRKKNIAIVETPHGVSHSASHNSTSRYPQPTDRYKGKTRNQYCSTQKIPIFRRNFTTVLEKDGKIIKVIKPQI